MSLQTALIAITALVAANALAQSDTAAADPGDPNIAVPRAQYRSAFAGYRAIGNEPVADWRAANDTVGRIGGWKVYAREAREVPAPAKTEASREPSSGMAKPAATPSGGPQR